MDFTARVKGEQHNDFHFLKIFLAMKIAVLSITVILLFCFCKDTSTAKIVDYCEGSG